MSHTVAYSLRVNGAEHDVADGWLGESLLYVLRERLGLPGSKNACEQGECGSCSVLRRRPAGLCSCLVLAAGAVGPRVATVEGLGRRDGRADRRAAGLRRRGRGAVRLLHARAGRWRCTTCSTATRDPTDLEMREAISGNLCRCTGYGRILARRAHRRSPPSATRQDAP